MKSSTQKSYHERIERVVAFLSEQVDNNPSLETLADVAAISPFHFHRVYRAVTGETPSGTVRRLRLAKACFLLKDARKPVTQVAFDVGYDSPQSFAKAFRSGTGFSPTEIRKRPTTLNEVMTLLSSPEAVPKREVRNIEVRSFTAKWAGVWIPAAFELSKRSQTKTMPGAWWTIASGQNKKRSLKVSSCDRRDPI